jgi:hypothetical protein
MPSLIKLIALDRKARGSPEKMEIKIYNKRKKKRKRLSNKKREK